MDQTRIKDLRTDFSKALERLEEALREDLSKGAIVIDGTIQRFEFTYELAWKLLKAVLKFQGIEAPTPRAAIKAAYQAALLEDGDGWIDMLEDRNQTSHIYDEAGAQRIYKKIKNSHIFLLRNLLSKIEQ